MVKASERWHTVKEGIVKVFSVETALIHCQNVHCSNALSDDLEGYHVTIQIDTSWVKCHATDDRWLENVRGVICFNTEEVARWLSTTVIDMKKVYVVRRRFWCIQLVVREN